MNMKDMRDERWKQWSKTYGGADDQVMYACWCAAWNHALGACIAVFNASNVEGIASANTPMAQAVFKAVRGEQEKP